MDATLVFIVVLLLITACVDWNPPMPLSHVSWFRNLPSTVRVPPGWVYGIIWTVALAFLAAALGIVLLGSHVDFYKPDIYVLLVLLVLIRGWGWAMYATHDAMGQQKHEAVLFVKRAQLASEYRSSSGYSSFVDANTKLYKYTPNRTLYYDAVKDGRLITLVVYALVTWITSIVSVALLFMDNNTAGGLMIVTAAVTTIGFVFSCMLLFHGGKNPTKYEFTEEDQ